MSEIKPCPFCGGVGKLVQHRIAEDAMEAYVCCRECYVHGVHVEDAYARGDDAIALWNRRPAEAELTASLNRASDACASVQKERDELREMLGEAVEMLRQSSHALSASYQEAQCEWTNSDKAAARHNETVRNFRNAVSALLARYEAGK